MQELSPVGIYGATGPFADEVNGAYIPIEERLNGKTVYSKLGDAAKCLYFATNKKWWVTYTVYAKEGELIGYAHTEEGLSHPTLAKQWNVFDGNSFQRQPVVSSVMVKLFNPFLHAVFFSRNNK